MAPPLSIRAWWTVWAVHTDDYRVEQSGRSRAEQLLTNRYIGLTLRSSSEEDRAASSVHCITKK